MLSAQLGAVQNDRQQVGHFFIYDIIKFAGGRGEFAIRQTLLSATQTFPPNRGITSPTDIMFRQLFYYTLFKHNMCAEERYNYTDRNKHARAEFAAENKYNRKHGNRKY